MFLCFYIKKKDASSHALSTLLVLFMIESLPVPHNTIKPFSCHAAEDFIFIMTDYDYCITHASAYKNKIFLLLH